MAETMKTVRVFFEKSGRAVYISHLDLTRAMSRALARSGLPVWYTQGFHPHLYMTFALPLSLGVTGRYESVDFRLLGEVPYDEIVRRLDEALPEGLHAVSAGEPVMEPKEIAWADYSIELLCDPEQGEQAVAQLEALPELLSEKRSKKGIKTVDIRPMFSVLGIEKKERGVTMKLRCRAGVETNLNPALVIENLSRVTGLTIVQSKLTREAVLRADLELFR